jgi:hypothetical protein
LYKKEGIINFLMEAFLFVFGKKKYCLHEFSHEQINKLFWFGVPTITSAQGLV